MPVPVLYCPKPHRRHPEDAFKLNAPPLQRWHALELEAPAADKKVPAMHCVQFATGSIMPVPVPYVPAVQRVHVLAGPLVV